MASHKMIAEALAHLLREHGDQFAEIVNAEVAEATGFGGAPAAFEPEEVSTFDEARDAGLLVYEHDHGVHVQIPDGDFVLRVGDVASSW